MILQGCFLINLNLRKEKLIKMSIKGKTTSYLLTNQKYDKYKRQHSVKINNTSINNTDYF